MLLWLLTTTTATHRQQEATERSPHALVLMVSVSGPVGEAHLPPTTRETVQMVALSPNATFDSLLAASMIRLYCGDAPHAVCLAV